MSVTPGQTDLTLPRFGLGCGTLGDPDRVLSEGDAQAVLDRAWALGIRYFDTAPWYGNTKSEHRTGCFLRQKPREDFILSTKVGRIYFRPKDPAAFRSSPWMARWKGGYPFDLRFDYSGAGILRSYEDSLMRLGLNRVDCLVIHDLDLRHQKTEAGVKAGLDALSDRDGFAVLADLKRRGEIRAIGAGINHIGMIPRFLDRFPIDFFLVAMPYTLLDQPALDGEFQMCRAAGVSVVIGAVFASGILAAPSSGEGQYAYQPAAPEIRSKVDRILEVCRRHDVALRDAALQFPLAHPCVTSVIPGANSPEQVTENFEGLLRPIPAEFWRDLQQGDLIRPDAPVPS